MDTNSAMLSLTLGLAGAWWRAVLLTGGLVVGGLWLNRQQAAQAREVEEDLQEATLAPLRSVS